MTGHESDREIRRQAMVSQMRSDRRRAYHGKTRAEEGHDAAIAVGVVAIVSALMVAALVVVVWPWLVP